jgi:hypothetical protein
MLQPYPQPSYSATTFKREMVRYLEYSNRTRRASYVKNIVAMLDECMGMRRTANMRAAAIAAEYIHDANKQQGHAR